MGRITLRSSEVVSQGHPDKVADYISDSILDACLEQDKNSRVACETAIKGKDVLVFGEITTNATIDFKAVVNKALDEIGYGKDYLNTFYRGEGDEFNVTVNLTTQSQDISDLVNNDEIGAGDQGIVWGYSTSETESRLPLPMEIAKKILKAYEDLRERDDRFKPDAKTLVTVKYEDDEAIEIDSVVLSASHSSNLSLDELRFELQNLIYEVLRDNYPTLSCDTMDRIEGQYCLWDSKSERKTKLYLNAYGKFEIYGPIADSGLTGRKVIVDTYGSFGHHGGGAFSGKDYTKVDRSGAYFARFLANSLVKYGYCKSCSVGLSYLIGSPNPIAVLLEVHDTDYSQEALDEAYEFLNTMADVSVDVIIDLFDLRNVKYTSTTWNHVGKIDGLPTQPWEVQ